MRVPAIVLPLAIMAIISACSSSPTAPSANAPAVAQGEKLVAKDSKETLYAYKKDAVGKSNCVRDCLKIYMPLFSNPDDKPGGDFSIIERPDGMNQWAFKGKALYTCPVPKLAAGAPAKTVAAAEKKAADCAKGLQGDWEYAKP